MFAVAGIDALGRIADEEILLPLQARLALEQRNAHLLGRAGIHGRLVDDGGALLQVASDRDAGADQRRKVRLVRLVDRRGHSDDDDVGFLQAAGVGRDLEPVRRLEVLGAHLAGRVDMPTIGVDLRLRQIESDRAHLLAELHRQRQPDIAQPHHSHDCCFQRLLPRASGFNLSLQLLQQGRYLRLAAEVL